MSIFDQKSTVKKDLPSFATDTPATPAHTTANDVPANGFGTSPTPTPATPARAASPVDSAKESLIASDLTIEGKIEGNGHVRIAGKFKGDVNVQGNLRLESGAKLNGGVRAKQVVVAGELDGNIESASTVELLESAVLIGDVKAGTLTVNAGSRIRGHVECGWDDKDAQRSSGKNGKAELDLAS